MSLAEINNRYSSLAESTCCLSCGGAIDFSGAAKGETCVDLGSGRGTDAIRLAEKNGLDPGKWDDNVSVYLERKSDPVYYGDPVVRYGRLKEGTYVNAYVDDILERYEHYKNIK